VSRLFISHSSRNNPEAAAIHVWLKEQGWDDVFLDVTADRGIAAGEKWERALNEAASRCEVVLFLISRDWIASRWCRKEYELARRLNKRLLGALIEIIPVADLPSEVTETFQMVDLASGADHRMIRAELPRTQEEVHVTFSREGLFRLKDGLTKAGLDPRFFAWPPPNDPGRAPYRGLKPLEQEDAGIFFGREAPIVEALDMLRGLADAAAPRLFVILGASGAGKSSFLRAGLLPRLSRDDRTFLTLPVIRPEGGAVFGETGFLAAIEGAAKAFGLALSRAAIRQAIGQGGAAVKPILSDIAAKATGAMVGTTKPPAITLAVDQAEELFVDGEGADLLALLRDLVASDEPEVVVLFTIRSDAYDCLETAPSLEGLRQRAFALLPMPRGAYQTVIEGPAARLSGSDRTLVVEPRLTQRLLEDIERGGGSDALPLLAFTLGQLFEDFGGSGALSLADYESFGGIQGAIEAALRRVMRAADRDPRIPRDEEARLLLLRRGLIPWLAGIDPETGSPRRRQARLSEIPADAEPLVRLLVEQRLLSVDRIAGGEGEQGEATVEPAHEALLRQWGLLRGWLTEDFAALAILDGVRRAARDWEANARGPDWLNHTGTRLAEAQEIAARDDLGASLGSSAEDYLAACRARDEAEEAARAEAMARERDLKDSQVRLAEADKLAAEEKARGAKRFARLAIAAVLAIGLALVAAGGFALLSHFQRQARDEALAAAEAGRWVAKSRGELSDDNAAEAVRSADAAYRKKPGEDTRSAVLTALLAVPDLAGSVSLPSDPAQALLWLPDGGLGVATRGHALRTFALPGADAKVWTAPKIAGRDGSEVRALRLLAPDRAVAALSDGSLVAFGPDGRTTELSKGEDGVVWSAAIGPGGRRILRAEGEGAILVSCGEAGTPCAASRIAEEQPRSVALDEAGRLAAIGGQDGRVTLFNAAGVQQGEGVEFASPVIALAFGEGLLAVGTASGEIAIVDLASRAVLLRTPASGRPAGALAFRPARQGRIELAATCGENAACLVRLVKGEEGLAFGQSIRLPGHKGAPTALSWSADGTLLAVAYADGIVRAWRPGAADVVGARLRPDDPSRISRIALSADGQRLATAGERRITVLDRRSGAVTRVLTSEDGAEPRALAFGPDGRLAIVREDGSVAIHPAAGDAAPAVKRWDVRANPGLAWLAGGTLAAALADGRIALIAPDGAESFLPSLGPGADAWGLAASPDGKHLFASYVRGEIRCWDWAAKTHVVLRASSPDLPPAERGGPESLSVSPDGRRLAVTGDDDAIRLFDADGSKRQTLRTEAPATRSVAYAPDGRHLAALGTDGRVYVWGEVEGALSRRLTFEPSDGSARSPSAASAMWLAWADPRTLLVAIGPAVQIVTLDEDAWLRRAGALNLK
jgi:WD40 repeat protein